MKSTKHGVPPARPGRTWPMVAMTVPVATMLGWHALARIFDVPGDSPLAWLGAACAAVLMAGAAALGQVRPGANRPK